MENDKSDGSWAWLIEEYFFKTPLREASEWSYLKVLRGFRSFVGEEVQPEAVTQRDVLRWRRHVLQEKKSSPHTWNNKVAHMRALYNFALKKEFITSRDNPFNDVSVKQTEKRKKTLSKNQMTRIYLTMQQFEMQEKTGQKQHSQCALYPVWYWLTVLDTLRFTGMRQNQLLHIRMMDIDLEENCIRLRLEGSKTHREWKVPIVSQLRPSLEILMERARNKGASPSDHLFHVSRFLCTDKVLALLPVIPPIQPLRSFFNRLSKECGFIVSPHRFRHTLATMLMMAPDRNLQLVKGLLGHRSLTTTMEYIEINMEVATKTLERELSIYTDSVRG